MSHTTRHHFKKGSDPGQSLWCFCPVVKRACPRVQELWLQKSHPDGIPNNPGNAVRIQFFFDFRPMKLNRLHGDPEPTSYFFVCEILRDHKEDLFLTVG